MTASRPSWLASVHHETAAMRRAGVRRLLVISGEPGWCSWQAATLCDALAGDWLWVGEQSERGVGCRPAALKTLLGREFLHAVFDARQALSVDALAALAGTLVAGSWLVLLVPPWSRWPRVPDGDSLRWSEQPQPIATPCFTRYFRASLLADPAVALLRQNRAPQLTPLPSRPPWQAPVPGRPTADQRRLLRRLTQAEPGIYIMIAPRGRGKSALAGMFAHKLADACCITAPAKAAVDVLRRYAGPDAPFFAPDALLARCREGARARWLLVDEAAALPLPLLRQLMGYFSHVLLTTTVAGYEGTGRGFLLKFCDGLPRWHPLVLDAPLRWSINDPLERWLTQTLLLEDADAQIIAAEPAPPDADRVAARVAPQDSAMGSTPPAVAVASAPSSAPGFTSAVRTGSRAVSGENPSARGIMDDRCAARWRIDRVGALTWRRQPAARQAFYRLLTRAHYRTSPIDLRRLMDAPGMSFFTAHQHGDMMGGLWLVEEGGLTPRLAHAVWAGYRRPPGSLVAQSLAAHGNLWRAPRLRSRRISRIAVAPAARRHGMGLAMIDQAARQAARDERDFLSVSFGYTAALWHFWRRAGFQLVRMGTHREASSGLYSAMALLPLSDAGRELTRRAAEGFERDGRLAAGEQQPLALEDWRCLAGFAFAQRPPEACRSALIRLIRHSTLPLPALRLWLTQPLPDEALAAHLALSGKKALWRRWRQETAAAMTAVDARLTRRWRCFSQQPTR
ncbi:Putative acetyltransferase [Sodalis praecaptivus]|uniref:tRNA(Met) cytidine acetyltransferase TmcA n=1 Tax=Sodalis praecaptivus TaxID=1239307 RepID=W0HR63_9GAMM|nr:Putative acetyltransferase [Sodalis praecaptivus]